jgi:hypothetical protein
MNRVSLQCVLFHVGEPEWIEQRLSHNAYIHRVSLHCEFFHGFKRMGERECFPTFLAYIGFLSGMNLFMTAKDAAVREGLMTHCTYIGFLFTWYRKEERAQKAFPHVVQI